MLNLTLYSGTYPEYEGIHEGDNNYLSLKVNDFGDNFSPSGKYLWVVYRVAGAKTFVSQQYAMASLTPVSTGTYTVVLDNCILVASGKLEVQVILTTSSDNLLTLMEKYNAGTATALIIKSRVYEYYIDPSIDPTESIMSESGGLSPSAKEYIGSIVDETLADGVTDLVVANKLSNGSNVLASGSRSHAEGTYTRAAGSYSHAEGMGSASNPQAIVYLTALGVASHAEGYCVLAEAEGSHAEGHTTYAHGKHSHAEGGHSETGGDVSHAEGYYTKANGFASHAEGARSVASADYSHAEGRNTLASAPHSHTEGVSLISDEGGSETVVKQLVASGTASHAEGCGTEASEFASHAEGYGTTASGVASHAEGEESIASGRAAHAEGHASKAGGNYSYAGGSRCETKSNAASSMAVGIDTVAASPGQFVCGEKNIEDANGEYLVIVGNGNENVRSNAVAIDRSGNLELDGDLKIGYGKGIIFFDTATGNQYKLTVQNGLPVLAAVQ